MPTDPTPQRRADAQRNRDAVVIAATAVFAEHGVDAPIRSIAHRAGVGIGTLYRHFPLRSDLVAAVFEHEIDACAEAAAVLTAGLPPDQALRGWLRRYTDLIEAKQGLAGALHSGDPAYAALPAYFDSRLQPALRGLLANAAGSGYADADPADLLHAVAKLSLPTDTRPGHAARMIDLLLDGLRYRGTD